MDHPDRITFQLEEPVTIGDKTITSLTLRKMKAKDLVAGDLVQGETRKAMAMFASMAGVPLQVIEELSLDDFSRLGEEAAPLMGKSAAKKLAELKRKEAAEEAGLVSLQ